MYYGFDIGRTKVALSMSDNGRQLQWEKRVSTPRDSYDIFLNAVCELVAEADRRSGCEGSVDIGIPGMPETEDGTLHAASAPAASDKPLCADLNACLDRSVRFDNDADCFTPSEAWGNESAQYPLVTGLILGTGVGSGLIFNGKPITGKSYITDEFGHMRLSIDALTVMGLDLSLRRRGYGQYGCIENYLSGYGFAWLYQHYYHRPLQAPEITALHDQGDEWAGAHVECYLDSSAACLENILTIADPDLVVIGGSLSNFPAATTQPAERSSHHLLPVARVPRIKHAYHDDAGGVRGVTSLHLTD